MSRRPAEVDARTGVARALGVGPAGLRDLPELRAVATVPPRVLELPPFTPFREGTFEALRQAAADQDLALRVACEPGSPCLRWAERRGVHWARNLYSKY